MEWVCPLFMALVFLGVIGTFAGTKQCRACCARVSKEAAFCPKCGDRNP